MIIEDSYKKLEKEHKRRKNNSGAQEASLKNPLELGNGEGDLAAPLLAQDEESKVAQAPPKGGIL